MSRLKLPGAVLTLGLLAAAVSSCSNSSQPGSGEGGAAVDARQVALADHPERVYWGDLHLHTLYSFDS
jgi:hypothetical protein